LARDARGAPPAKRIIGVPRFFEKFHQDVLAQMRAGGGWRAALAAWALGVGLQRAAWGGDDKAPAWPLRWRHWLAGRPGLQRLRHGSISQGADIFGGDDIYNGV